MFAINIERKFYVPKVFAVSHMV